MKKFICVCILSVAVLTVSYAQSICKKSAFNYEETRSKVEKLITNQFLTIFAIHNHTEIAARHGFNMPSAVVILFGNPEMSASIMLDNPLWTLYLPLKVAIYDDAEGRTWIAVPDLKAIESEDKVGPEQEKTLQKMSQILDGILNIK